MHHCVATYAKKAAAGLAQVFHANLEGRPLTVMTERRDGRLRLVEAAGACNRPPTSEEHDLLSRWIAAVSSHDSTQE